jgi:16S rRNA processing protein RimM
VYYPLDAAVGDLVGDMTWDSFVGYVVLDTRLGILGPITMVDESTINVLLQVDYKGNEILIPAAEELILGVDHDKKLLEVALPDGLLDL